MHPIACTQCGHAISPTSFECPFCGEVGPNRTGRESKGITRGRWTVICAGLLGIALLFPPTRQLGEYTVDGQTRLIDHRFMPSWIGGADDGADIGYTRNGQLQTITWNITREINRTAWAVVLGTLVLAWLVGMFVPRQKRPPTIVHYRHEITPVSRQASEAPPWAGDRVRQASVHGARTIYPGVSVPGNAGPDRQAPPPPGRHY